MNLFADSKPFKSEDEYRIAIIGTPQKKSRAQYKKILENLGAKVSYMPSREMRLLFALDDPDEKALAALEEYRYDGLEFDELSETDLENIAYGKYETYTDRKRCKDNPRSLKLSPLHIERSRFVLEYGINEYGVNIFNPILSRMIAIPREIWPNWMQLGQIIGLLGADGIPYLDDDTQIILLPDSTFDSLMAGDRDAAAAFIESRYNQLKPEHFSWKLMKMGDFMDFVRYRLSINDDTALKAAYEKL